MEQYVFEFQFITEDSTENLYKIITSYILLHLLLELLNQGVHHERNKTFYFQQNNNAIIGR